jgi:hypothetical protein
MQPQRHEGTKDSFEEGSGDNFKLAISKFLPFSDKNSQLSNYCLLINK